MESVEQLSWGRARVLARAGVVVLAVLWLVPLVDSGWAAWPFHPSSVQWRFQAVSMLGGTLITQLYAITAAALLGGLLGWRWLVRAASVLALGLMLCTAFGLIIHSMDYLQLQASVQEDARHNFAQAMARGTAQLVFGIVASGVLAVGGFLASNATADSRQGASRVVVVPGPSA